MTKTTNFRTQLLGILVTIIVLGLMYLAIKGLYPESGISKSEGTLSTAQKSIAKSQKSLRDGLKEAQANRKSSLEQQSALPSEDKAERAVLQREIDSYGKRINQFHKLLNEPGENFDNSNSIKRVLVQYQTVQPRRITDTLILPANAEAYEDIELAARNEGTVEWLGVKDGDSIKVGQALAKIDERILKHRVSSARAAERLAAADYRRMESLSKKNVASAQDLDRDRSVWEQSQAALAIAQQNLEDAVLRSPIDGQVDDVYPDVGEYIKLGKPLARLVDISKIKMRLNVPEKDIAYLHEGMSAVVHLPEPHVATTTGTITRLGIVADDLSRTFPVEVTVDNSDGFLRPGMITKVEMVRRTHNTASVVSVFSVIQTQNGPMIYVEEDGVAVARKIKVGIRKGMEVEVAEGLEIGDHLIVVGQRSLSDGTAVKASEVSKP